MVLTLTTFPLDFYSLDPHTPRPLVQPLPPLNSILILLTIDLTSADATPMLSAPMTISWMGVLVHTQTLIQTVKEFDFHVN